MPTSYTVCFGFGSNVRFPRGYLARALKKLRIAVTWQAVSSPYQSAALLPKDAPKSWDIPYINLCAIGQTNWSPYDLLRLTQRTELELGRLRTRKHWSPRTLDIDILTISPHPQKRMKGLDIPHPGMTSRGFVLLPLAEISHDPQIHRYKHALNDKLSTTKLCEAIR